MYPSNDRRAATGPRRSGSGDRRSRNLNFDWQDRRIAAEERRTAPAERRQPQIDANEALRRLVGGAPSAPQSKVIEVLKVGLLPAIVGVASIGVTHHLSQQQQVNARLIAESQIQSGKEIAAAQLRNSAQISEARLKTERLRQIVEIFDGIVGKTNTPTVDRKVEAASVPKVAALEVYEDDALPFLMRLSKHFEPRSSRLKKEADEAIDRVLQMNQLDFSQRQFRGDGQRLNLRHRSYADFNLSGASFASANLFRANFSDASLQDATFENVDLQEADFGGAILTGVAFTSRAGSKASERTNLKYTNFEGANLHGVSFEKCSNLKYARFSLHALLSADQEPFSSIHDDDYVPLLMRHEEAMKEMNANDPDRLSVVLARLDLDFDGLLDEFEDIRTEQPSFRTNSAPGGTPSTDWVKSLPLLAFDK